MMCKKRNAMKKEIFLDSVRNWRHLIFEALRAGPKIRLFYKCGKKVEIKIPVQARTHHMDIPGHWIDDGHKLERLVLIGEKRLIR